MKELHHLKVAALELREEYQNSISKFEAASLRKEKCWRGLQIKEDALNEAAVACYYFKVVLEDTALDEGRDLLFANPPPKHGSESTKPIMAAYYSGMLMVL